MVIMIVTHFPSILGLLFCTCILYVVHASISGDVRLVGGQGSFEGRLEVYHSGRWQGVCDDIFDTNNNGAAVVCRQLGFSSRHAQFTRGIRGSTAFWLDEVNCAGNELRITSCGHAGWGQHDCTPSEHLWIKCDSSACSNNNGGCSHVCINTNGSHYCQCPDVELELAADNRTCYAPGVRVLCSSQDMAVEFNKHDFPGLHAQYLTLTDTTCTAKDTPSGDHISITAPLDGCGTRLHLDGDDFVYTNQVLARQVSVHGLVSHVRDISVDVRCRYSKFSLVRNLYLVNTEELNLHSSNQGNYQVSMNFIYNGHIYEPTSFVPLAVKPGEKLSVKLNLHTNDSNLQIFAKECKATPTSDVHNQVQYLLLENGCAHDTTLSFKNISDVTEQTLTLESFKFLGGLTTVYFHCEVLVCNVSDPTSRCHMGCLRPGEGRRMVQEAGPDGNGAGQGVEWEGSGEGGAGPGGESYLTVHSLSAGPVTFQGGRSKRDIRQDHPQTKGNNSEFLAVTAGVALLALSVALATTAVYILLRR